MTRNAFTVTAEFAGDVRWRVCRGRSTSEAAGPAWPASPAQLSAFADTLCSETGSWAVRSVVFDAGGQ